MSLKMSTYAWVFFFTKYRTYDKPYTTKKPCPLRKCEDGTDLASRVQAPGAAVDHWRSYSPCLHNTWNRTKRWQGQGKTKSVNNDYLTLHVHSKPFAIYKYNIFYRKLSVKASQLQSRFMSEQFQVSRRVQTLLTRSCIRVYGCNMSSKLRLNQCEIWQGYVSCVFGLNQVHDGFYLVWPPEDVSDAT